MQLSNAPSKLVLPFANSGGKNTIPVASQIGITAGAASLTDGFPPLTRTPKASGGIPPFGLDMNGILYETTSLSVWANAGGFFVWDGTFASTVGGYPAGAQVLRSDGLGFWINQVDNNTTDPETTGITGWVPGSTVKSAAVTMTSSNVTLTALQYGCPQISLSGLLTTNLNLIFPAIPFSWIVTNGCTGAFVITAKTASGTGVVLQTTGPTVIYGDGTNIYYSLSTNITRQVFTSNGTWTKPAGLKYAEIVCISAGGSGAKGTNGGGGGGAGAETQGLFAASSLSATETVTVGTGGASKTTNGNGNDGGNSSFGSHLVCTGGAGGQGTLGGSSGTVSTAGDFGGGLGDGIDSITRGDASIAGGNGGGPGAGGGANSVSGKTGHSPGAGGGGTVTGTGSGAGADGIIIVTHYF